MRCSKILPMHEIIEIGRTIRRQWIVGFWDQYDVGVPPLLRKSSLLPVVILEIE